MLVDRHHAAPKLPGVNSSLSPSTRGDSGELPVRHHLPVIIGDHRFRFSADRPGREIETNQLALGAHRVDGIAVDRGSVAWPGLSESVPHRTDLAAQTLCAVGEVQGSSTYSAVLPIARSPMVNMRLPAYDRRLENPAPSFLRLPCELRPVRGPLASGVPFPSKSPSRLGPRHPGQSAAARVNESDRKSSRSMTLQTHEAIFC